MIIQQIKLLAFKLTESEAPPVPFKKRSFQFRFELSSSAPRHQFVRIQLFAKYSCYLAELKQWVDFSADIHFVSPSYIRYFERKEGQSLRPFLLVAYEKAANKLAEILKAQKGEAVVPFLSILNENDEDLGELLAQAASDAVLLEKEDEEDHGRFI